MAGWLAPPHFCFCFLQVEGKASAWLDGKALAKGVAVPDGMTGFAAIGANGWSFPATPFPFCLHLPTFNHPSTGGTYFTAHTF